jgi:arylsulfatase/arylsulfatase A
VLTRQDWRHSAGRNWASNSNGFWLLEAREPGSYEAEVIFASDHPAGTATITAGSVSMPLDIPANQRRGHSVTLKLLAGKMKLAVDVVFNGKTQGPHQVILTRK